MLPIGTKIVSYAFDSVLKNLAGVYIFLQNSYFSEPIYSTGISYISEQSIFLIFEMAKKLTSPPTPIKMQNYSDLGHFKLKMSKNAEKTPTYFKIPICLSKILFFQQWILVNSRIYPPLKLGRHFYYLCFQLRWGFYSNQIVVKSYHYFSTLSLLPLLLQVPCSQVKKIGTKIAIYTFDSALKNQVYTFEKFVIYGYYYCHFQLRGGFYSNPIVVKSYQYFQLLMFSERL